MAAKKKLHDCKNCKHCFPQFGVYNCLHRCHKLGDDFVIFKYHKITDCELFEKKD